MRGERRRRDGARRPFWGRRDDAGQLPTVKSAHIEQPARQIYIDLILLCERASYHFVVNTLTPASGVMQHPCGPRPQSKCLNAFAIG